MRRGHGLIGTTHPGSVAAPFPSRARYPAIMKTIFLNSTFSHPPGRSPDVCPCADSATLTHEFLAVPSHASSISRLQPHLHVAFPPRPSGWVAFKTHNGRGPNAASFKRLYRKRPGGNFLPRPWNLVTGSLQIQH